MVSSIMKKAAVVVIIQVTTMSLLFAGSLGILVWKHRLTTSREGGVGGGGGAIHSFSEGPVQGQPLSKLDVMRKQRQECVRHIRSLPDDILGDVVTDDDRSKYLYVGPYLKSPARPDLHPLNTSTSTSTSRRGLIRGGPLPEPDHPPVSAHNIFSDKQVDLLFFVRADDDDDDDESKITTEEIKNQGDDRRRSEIIHYWRNYLDNLPDGRGRGVTFRVVNDRDRDDITLGKVVVIADDRRLRYVDILSFLSTDVPFVYVVMLVDQHQTTSTNSSSWAESCQDEDTLMYHSSESMEDGIDKALNMLYEDNELRSL